MTSTGASPETGLVDALHGPSPNEDAADLMLFGRFVGSWDLQWTGTDADGATSTMPGELHFGWVLGGRAVQDIWIVPGRSQPGRPRFHGTTIRFHDDSIGLWRSTWIEPVNGLVRRFLGRAVGDEILLLSDEESPWLRWRFTDIRDDSFTWRGEISHDAGVAWRVDEEMLATRVEVRT